MEKQLMRQQHGPRHLLVRAHGNASPLSTADAGVNSAAEPDEFVHEVPLDDARLDLPGDLAQRLSRWNRGRDDGGLTARSALRRHAAEGLEAAQDLARHLGPDWVVRYFDERHAHAKFVCWGCGRLHWSADTHGTAAHPRHIVVQGQYKWFPLRAEGFGDFAPDDPTAALGLPDDLVRDLYRWAKDVDSVMETWLNDRDDAARETAYDRLEAEGAQLARRVTHALAPGRTATYAGIS
ncbi:hypothetical protein ACF1AY_10000 [Streptomyces sp. NPDC014776]|uniref:hypothetical protein n=1 Tax=unclassified Streptomyces TaxID=2593676 RepID=UPI0036FBB988